MDEEVNSVDSLTVCRTLNTYIQSNGCLAEVLSYIDGNQVTPQTYKRSCGARDLDSPVGVAALSGRVDVMNALIDRGFAANENCRTALGYSCTPIHLACKMGHVTVVKSLVEDYGVSVNVDDEWGNSPLCSAVKSGSADVVKYLLMKGATLDFREQFTKSTYLHFVADTENVEMCTCLVSHGCDVRARDVTGCTPLHVAATSGNVGMGKILLEACADVNAVDSFNRTPFFNAATEGHTEMLRLLFSNGANPRACDSNGTSPLLSAIEFCGSNTNVVRYLLVDVNANLSSMKNVRGKAPLLLAVQRGLKGIVDLIISTGYNITQNDVTWCSHVVGEGESAAKLVMESALMTRTLQDICCFAIRRALGMHLAKNVDKLAVPEAYIKFIRLDHLSPNNINTSETYDICLLLRQFPGM
ncbi:ankyrin repeat, PH and SEC7 domain containing protein secG-like [Haliotis asinina]|uniref:ankyrin repeat, PH and SEC7 domain containing protein secG-like n=1 Tax=Haliotis asinina TaxID=109174 RepID=UPI0035322F3F